MKTLQNHILETLNNQINEKLVIRKNSVDGTSLIIDFLKNKHYFHTRGNDDTGELYWDFVNNGCLEDITNLKGLKISLMYNWSSDVVREVQQICKPYSHFYVGSSVSDTENTDGMNLYNDIRRFIKKNNLFYNRIYDIDELKIRHNNIYFFNNEYIIVLCGKNRINKNSGDPWMLVIGFND